MNTVTLLVGGQFQPVPLMGTGYHTRRPGRVGRVTNPYPAPAYRYGYGLPALVEDRKHEEVKTHEYRLHTGAVALLSAAAEPNSARPPDPPAPQPNTSTKATRGLETGRTMRRTMT